MKISIVCLGCAMMVLAGAAVNTHLATKSGSCSQGWTEISSRCFHYVQKSMPWADAERHCQSMGANLASVHCSHEYHDIQKLIKAITHDSKEAWIGGSNAQQVKVWLWTDGSSFHYANWCGGHPNNGRDNQRCLQINYSGRKCWDDVECNFHLPFVCAKKA